MAQHPPVIVVSSGDHSSYNSIPRSVIDLRGARSGTVDNDSSDSEEFTRKVNLHDVIDLRGSRSVIVDNLASAIDRASRVKGNKTRSFVIPLKKSFIEGDCRLLLPVQHGNTFLAESKDKEVTLRVGNRSWIVLVKQSNNQHRLGRGWRSFVQDNGLQIDDACQFHLLPCGKVYIVKIFKA